jgi:hypothetical protein
MSKRFEGWTRNAEAMTVRAVVAILAVAILISWLRGG